MKTTAESSGGSNTAKMSFAEIAKININEHTEKKGALTYLSWAWALDQLMRLDQSATWEYKWIDGKPYCQIGETVMVFCTVNAFGISRTAQLPVMDNRNKPILNPNAFEINTAMMRALAKAIALHGLGLYIYAGEDLPMEEKAGEDSHVVSTEALNVCLDAIDAAENLESLKKEYATAYRVVSNDEHALKIIIKAKDKRKAKLTDDLSKEKQKEATEV